MIAVIGVAAFFALSCLMDIAVFPIRGGVQKSQENASSQSARAIELAMFAYANDHNGAYPDGASSTEVFQKLIDQNYITDPSVFYIRSNSYSTSNSYRPKTQATSKKLLPENVCYDVTLGVDSTSPDDLPVVFSTGYKITYANQLEVARDPAISSPFPGIAVAYKSNVAHFWKARYDGTIPSVIPPSFSLGPKTYRQLTP